MKAWKEEEDVQNKKHCFLPFVLKITHLPLQEYSDKGKKKMYKVVIDGGLCGNPRFSLNNLSKCVAELRFYMKSSFEKTIFIVVSKYSLLLSRTKNMAMQYNTIKENIRIL